MDLFLLKSHRKIITIFLWLWIILQAARHTIIGRSKIISMRYVKITALSVLCGISNMDGFGSAFVPNETMISLYESYLNNAGK
ncbi:MAG: hypothetical protein ACK5H4_14520 [Lacrimispora sphenoides]